MSRDNICQEEEAGSEKGGPLKGSEESAGVYQDLKRNRSGYRILFHFSFIPQRINRIETCSFPGGIPSKKNTHSG
jgi:hypothetical protein